MDGLKVESLPPKQVKRLLLGCVVSTVALIGGLFLFSSPLPTNSAQDSSPPVRTTTAIIQNYNPSVELIAQVRSLNTAQLSSPVAGYVTEILVREGQTVTQAQPLLRLDTQKIDLLISQQEAQSARIRAELKELQLQHQRNQATFKQRKRALTLSEKRLAREERLLKNSVASVSQRDAVEQNVLAERVTLEELQYNLNAFPSRQKALTKKLVVAEKETQRLNLDKKRMTLTAPFDGVVTNRAASPGERVNLSQPLLELVDLNHLEVIANIPVRYQPQFDEAYQRQQPVLAQTASAESKLKLHYIGQTVEQGELGQNAYFIPTEGAPLLHNKTLLLTVTLPAQRSIALPQGSLYNGDTVYTVEENNRLKPVHIQLVGRTLLNQGEPWMLLQASQELTDRPVLSHYLSNAREGLLVSPSLSQP